MGSRMCVVHQRKGRLRKNLRITLATRSCVQAMTYIMDIQDDLGKNGGRGARNQARGNASGTAASSA